MSHRNVFRSTLISLTMFCTLLASCAPRVVQPTATPTAIDTPTASPQPTATATVAFMSTVTSTPIPQPTLPWKLAWSDEFDGSAGSAPDSGKWGYDLGGKGWGNGEYEYYTGNTDNSALDGNGNLVITARKIDDPGKTQLTCWYGNCEYTSGRLLTKGKYEFTYGRVEARIRLPKGQGIWPAFWLLGNDIDSAGWPQCGEVDIMENIGKETYTVHGTVHGPGYSGAGGIGQSYMLKKGYFADDFHVFALEWDPQELRWYVDGELYSTVKSTRVHGDWVFNHPYFIILNIAVGGSWSGAPNDSTQFPQTMLVDYVRVYQH